MRHPTQSELRAEVAGLVNGSEKQDARRSATLLAAWCAALACINFDLEFPCPAHVTDCRECAPDGTCLRPLERTAPASVSREPALPADGGPEEKVPQAAPPNGGLLGPPRPPREVGPEPPAPAAPDGGPVNTEPCAGLAPLDSELCPVANGPQPCLMESVRENIVLWLDPLSLSPPAESSPAYWCDRSGRANHAVHMPEQQGRLLADDTERGVAAPLQRSLVLGGNWLLLPSALQLGTEDFALLMAAATPPPVGRTPTMHLFGSESEVLDDLNLTVYPPGSDFGVEARVQQETPELELVLRTAPSLYDARYHLLTLRRLGSQTLQLRLNGELVARDVLPGGVALAAAGNRRITAVGANDLNPTQTSTVRGRVAAVVMLKGSVADDQLAAVEQALCERLQVCSPPAPAGVAAAPPTDAGAPVSTRPATRGEDGQGAKGATTSRDESPGAREPVPVQRDSDAGTLPP